MGEPLLITSRQNPRVKQLMQLRQRRARDRAGLFLIEGYREITRALAGKIPLRELFICPDLYLGSQEETRVAEAEAQGAAIFTCSPELFHHLSYRDRPDGLLAVAPHLKQEYSGSLSSFCRFDHSPLLFIAESIEKPGNLGTILRTAEGAGVDALVLANPVTDLHNPNVVRASVGALFLLPVLSFTTKELLPALQKEQIPLVVATPDGEELYTEADLRGPIALAVGSEQYGMSEELARGAHRKIRIPMRGRADSLNVAMAAGILLYEVLRQRGIS